MDSMNVNTKTLQNTQATDTLENNHVVIAPRKIKKILKKPINKSKESIETKNDNPINIDNPATNDEQKINIGLKHDNPIIIDDDPQINNDNLIIATPDTHKIKKRKKTTYKKTSPENIINTTESKNDNIINNNDNIIIATPDTQRIKKRKKTTYKKTSPENTVNTTESKNDNIINNNDNLIIATPDTQKIKKRKKNTKTITTINTTTTSDKLEIGNLTNNNNNSIISSADGPKKIKKRKKLPKEKNEQDAPVCSVCCETFNRSTRKCINCTRCDYKACKECHQKFLLNSISTAHCMNCRNIWTYKDLLLLFKQTFVNVTYRKQRGQYLKDRAKSFIPMAMPFADVQVRLKEITQEVKGLNTLLNDLRQNPSDPDYQVKRKSLYDALIIKNNQKHALYTQSYAASRSGNTNKAYTNFEETCPVNECRGFVNKERHCCGLCKMFVCNKCLKPIGTMTEDEKVNQNHSSSSSSSLLEEKNALHDINSLALTPDEKKQLFKLKKNHICKTEDVESVKEIHQHSRPCPNCKSKIFRISGCDTMWCTVCNTGFNWRTGMIINNAKDLHNPHYVDFIRKNPNFQYKTATEEKKHAEEKKNTENPPAQPAPHNPCDQLTLQTITLPDINYINVIISKSSSIIQNVIIGFQQLMGHNRDYAIRHFVNRNNPDDVEYALRYLTHQWDEKRWRIQLEHNDRFRQTNREYVDVFMTWLVVMNDLFTKYILQEKRFIEHDKAKQFIKQMIEITQYTNKLLSDMNQMYKRVTVKISIPAEVNTFIETI